jgi:hypothetical protein
VWLDSDVDAALAWQEEQASLCPGCAHPLDETTHPDASYYATPVVCRHCAATQSAAAADRDEGGATHGALWIVKPSPDLVPD